MNLLDGKRKASHYKRLSEKKVQCTLCPRGCKLGNGKRGFCGTRQNIDGDLYTLVYGKAVRVAQEYIETEGVYHFAPGAPILSIGNIGCNLHCKFCQNWRTSQMKFIEDGDYEVFTPEQIVNLALNKGIHILSWTYNDPVVWHEFVMDTARLAKQHGLLNLYKSAFYLTLEPVKELCEVFDVISVSLKSIREDYYRQHANGTLAPILENIRYVHQSGVHLEVSNLMVTDLNDSEEDAREIARWHLENTSAETPLHYVRFHPAYLYDKVLRTPVDRLERARQIAKEMGVKYCYVGNVFESDSGNSYCPECQNLLVKRFDINVETPGLTSDGHCQNCGHLTSIKVKPFSNVMQKVDDNQYQHLSKEIYRWTNEVNRFHVEVKNTDKTNCEIQVYRLGHNSKSDILLQRTKILAEEKYQFIISKSKPEENGIVLCYPPQLKIRVSELLDRAHLPMDWKSQKKKYKINDRSFLEKIQDTLKWQKGINPVITRKILYPAYLKLKRLPVLQHLKELDNSQWYNETQMGELQLSKLKKLVQHCENYVPYYQSLFKKNDFNANMLGSLNDLRKLPVLEKSDVLENGKTFYTTGKNLAYFRAKTAGSTGQPLQFLTDYNAVSYSIAARIRAMRWWGLDYGLKEAHFWGRGSANKSFLLKIGDYLFRNKIILSTFDLSEDRMFEYYKKLKQFKPDIIYGNPSAIFIFSRFILEHDLDRSVIKAKAVICTTEILYEFQRQLISQVFGCPTINEYGGAEVGIVAYECPEHHFHLSTENIIIEILRDNQPCKPGEFGEIVITNLNNYIFPFIRYRLGDVGSFIAQECPCGRKLPLLDLAVARDCDTLILEDRELPGGVLFGRLGKELLSVTNGDLRAYKVFQKDFHKFLLQVVLAQKDKAPQLENKTKQIIEELLGPDISIDFEYVDSIPRDSSGKLRYFVSEIFKQ
ncbi:AmmeMemoRadiSam system radical SAM enzyme [candidate division KSB1 bacterium]|nr:AmmeMemoRadiSam system radical SAM enzyme [candidate division KSB1 bacterium]